MKIRTDAERAQRVAVAVAVLGSIGIAFDHVTTPAAPDAVPVAAIGICLGMLVWMEMTRRRARAWRGNTAFLIVQVAILWYLWASQDVIAASGISWVPFRANRLGALTVALVAPPQLWVGVLGILAFTGTAVIQLALFDPAVRDHIAYGDPWATLAFGGFGIGVLIYRLRGRAIERESARVQAEAQAMERTARAMLAIRDLAATPLQTLVGAVELLKRRGGANHELVERIERATNRIADLEQLTRPYQHVLPLRPEDATWNPRDAVREAASPELRR